MGYSNKRIVHWLGEYLLSFGIQEVVVSPGSRNGALIMHFTHHPDFRVHTIVDERVAGFFAMGLARQSGRPVALTCTSGSAVANYYPAVVEAFYQNTPLVLLTADRPTEFVDIFDGQTIRQNNFFDQHAYGSIQLSDSESDEDKIKREVSEILSKAVLRSGPVHINLPFSEPLYNAVQGLLVPKIKPQKVVKPTLPLPYAELASRWNQANRKLILVGMHQSSTEFDSWLGLLANDPSVVVMTETTSNLNNSRFFGKIDQLIFNFKEKEKKLFRPDILLTIGQMVVSKKIKNILRDYKDLQHWHVDPFWQPDTYFALKEALAVEKVEFLSQFQPLTESKSSEYFEFWNEVRNQKKRQHLKLLENISWSDLKVFEHLADKIPADWMIHFANSSPIRYSQLFDFKHEIHCNRGTSGIDGSTSTAIGACVGSKKKTVLITGDLSFFYDSNALWIKPLPDNFRIIVMNNGGGNIFKIIPGPENTAALEASFEARHDLTAEHLCSMYGVSYQKVDNEKDLVATLETFFKSASGPKLLELDTRNAKNAEILRSYFQTIG